MPVSYTIDGEARLVSLRAWDVLSEDDLRSTGAQLRSDPLFNPDFNQYMELSDVTDISVSAATMSAMARVSVFSPGARRAFVAVNDMQFGMARMFAMYSESLKHDIRVFRTKDDAMAWLNG